MNFLLHNRYYVEILPAMDKLKHINMFNGFILLGITGDPDGAEMRFFDFYLLFYDFYFYDIVKLRDAFFHV